MFQNYEISLKNGSRWFYSINAENKIDQNSDKIAEAIKSNFGNSIFKSYKLKELVKFKNGIEEYLDQTRNIL